MICFQIDWSKFEPKIQIDAFGMEQESRIGFEIQKAKTQRSNILVSLCANIRRSVINLFGPVIWLSFDFPKTFQTSRGWKEKKLFVS